MTMGEKKMGGAQTDESHRLRETEHLKRGGLYGDAESRSNIGSLGDSIISRISVFLGERLGRTLGTKCQQFHGRSKRKTWEKVDHIGKDAGGLGSKAALDGGSELKKKNIRRRNLADDEAHLGLR